MTYVIAEPCIGVKDNSCVEVCPVDCIHPTPDEPDYGDVEQLFIRSTPTTTGRVPPSDMGHARPDLKAAALASLAAAAAAIAVMISEPFAHGAWLVAYLVLVGFLAQLLLGRGQAALLSTSRLPAPPAGVRLAQALLWNLGVVAVPVGVLAETRLAVVAGSVGLIAALVSLWRSARPALGMVAGPSPLGWGYAWLLVVMTASVFVGTALAWDIPWT